VSSYGITARTIYLLHCLNMMVMTEFEWETERIPRVPRPTILGGHRRRPDALGRYVALELPRESVGWLLKGHSRSRRDMASRGAVGVRGRLRRWLLATRRP